MAGNSGTGPVEAEPVETGRVEEGRVETGRVEKGPDTTGPVDLTVVAVVPEGDWVAGADDVVGRLRAQLAVLARRRGLTLPPDLAVVRTRVQSGRVVAVVRAGGRPG